MFVCLFFLIAQLFGLDRNLSTINGWINFNYKQTFMVPRRWILMASSSTTMRFVIFSEIYWPILDGSLINLVQNVMNLNNFSDHSAQFNLQIVFKNVHLIVSNNYQTNAQTVSSDANVLKMLALLLCHVSMLNRHKAQRKVDSLTEPLAPLKTLNLYKTSGAFSSSCCDDHFFFFFHLKKLILKVIAGNILHKKFGHLDEGSNWYVSMLTG